MTDLPKWVTEAIGELPAVAGWKDFREGAEFGARLILDRLAATAENDYKSIGPEAKALNIARERVRKEVLDDQV